MSLLHTLFGRFQRFCAGLGGSRHTATALVNVESLENRTLLSRAGILTAGEVHQLLRRAAAASGHNDAIIAIVDREGDILGVRVEGACRRSSPATPSAWCLPSMAPWPWPAPAPSSPTTPRR
jgi:hypothetical protein